MPSLPSGPRKNPKSNHPPATVLRSIYRQARGKEGYQRTPEELMDVRSNREK